MAKITPEFVIAALIIGVIISGASQFVAGLIDGLMDWDFQMTDSIAWAWCITGTIIVFLILIFIQIRAPEKTVSNNPPYMVNQQPQFCPACQAPLQYNMQQQRWFCYNCNMYF
jgi:hypothetical protein